MQYLLLILLGPLGVGLFWKSRNQSGAVNGYKWTVDGGWSGGFLPWMTLPDGDELSLPEHPSMESAKNAVLAEILKLKGVGTSLSSDPVAGIAQQLVGVGQKLVP